VAEEVQEGRTKGGRNHAKLGTSKRVRLPQQKLSTILKDKSRSRRGESGRCREEPNADWEKSFIIIKKPIRKNAWEKNGRTYLRGTKVTSQSKNIRE